MNTDARPCHNVHAWDGSRLAGRLGSASDQALDAHLLACESCFARLIAQIVGADIGVPEPVSA